MLWILLLSLLLLCWLFLASDKWVWWKAGAFSLLLLMLSAWWLIDKLSGDGLNAATLYHLGADMEGAGVSDFKGYIAGFIVLALVSLLPLFATRVKRWRRPGHGGAVRRFRGRVGGHDHDQPAGPRRPAPVPAAAPGRLRPHRPEYQVPTQPLQRPRNIVWIYGESLERTYLDEAVFPGLMPNLNRPSESLDVRGLASAEGSGWTIAGLVSSMCGVPLTTSQGDENSMDRMGSFLPKAVCLGDYLKQQGYTNHYLGGANGQFAGKGQFLASHGFDEVHDLAWFKQQKKIGRIHYSAWGVHDDVLLDTAYQRFEQLSRAGSPFMLTTLTMDTHHPAGPPAGVVQGRALPEPVRQHQHAQRAQVQRPADLAAGAAHPGQPVRQGHADRDRLRPPGDAQRSDPHPDPAEAREPAAVPGRWHCPAAAQRRRRHHPGFGCDPAQPAGPEPEDDGLWPFADRYPARAQRQRGHPRDGGRDYPQYLAFARSLWLGEPTRELKIDGDDQVVVGLQHVQPPVLLEYDKDWGLKSVYLENTSRQFDDADPDNTLAYVDRCTAFEDGSADGDWCALLVNRDNGIKLYRDNDLRGGIAVDAPLDAFQGPRPSVRQAHMITQKGRRTVPASTCCSWWRARARIAASGSRRCPRSARWCWPSSGCSPMPTARSTCRSGWTTKWMIWRSARG
jgi:phosphoglycerol transferase